MEIKNPKKKLTKFKLDDTREGNQKKETYRDMFAISGLPYKMKLSNYTYTLENDKQKVMFMAKEMSKKSFIAYRKILSDVSTHSIPDINREQNYYHYNYSRFEKDISEHEIMCFDIKSAYASVLRNKGYIQQKTFDYLSGLEKQDRLACVGMLASKNHTFFFDENSELIEDIDCEHINPMKNFFFNCVDQVHEFMHLLSVKFKNDFLFFWVDGIYFKRNDEIIDSIHTFFQEYNFEYHVENYTDFKIINYEKFIYLEFIDPEKITDDYDGKKYFNFRKKNSTFARDILKLFNLI